MRPPGQWHQALFRIVSAKYVSYYCVHKAFLPAARASECVRASPLHFCLRIRERVWKKLINGTRGENTQWQINSAIKEQTLENAAAFIQHQRQGLFGALPAAVAALLYSIALHDAPPYV